MRWGWSRSNPHTHTWCSLTFTEAFCSRPGSHLLYMSADCLLNERETTLHCNIMRLWVLMTTGCHSKYSYTDATHFQAPFIQLVGLQCYQSLARVLRHHLTGPYQAPLSRVLLVCFVSPTSASGYGSLVGRSTRAWTASSRST